MYLAATPGGRHIKVHLVALRTNPGSPPPTTSSGNRLKFDGGGHGIHDEDAVDGCPPRVTVKQVCRRPVTDTRHRFAMVPRPRVCGVSGIMNALLRKAALLRACGAVVNAPLCLRRNARRRETEATRGEARHPSGSALEPNYCFGYNSRHVIALTWSRQKPSRSDGTEASRGRHALLT